MSKYFWRLYGLLSSMVILGVRLPPFTLSISQKMNKDRGVWVNMAEIWSTPYAVTLLITRLLALHFHSPGESVFVDSSWTLTMVWPIYPMELCRYRFENGWKSFFMSLTRPFFGHRFPLGGMALLSVTSPGTMNEGRWWQSCQRHENDTFRNEPNRQSFIVNMLAFRGCRMGFLGTYAALHIPESGLNADSGESI